MTDIAIKGLLMCLALLVFIISNLLVVYCINREKDKAAHFWMVVALLSGFVALHLTKYF